MYGMLNYEYSLELIGTLLDNGANIDCADFQGRTPLTIAIGGLGAEKNNYELLRFLLDKREDQVVELLNKRHGINDVEALNAKPWPDDVKNIIGERLSGKLLVGEQVDSAQLGLQ